MTADRGPLEPRTRPVGLRSVVRVPGFRADPGDDSLERAFAYAAGPSRGDLDAWQDAILGKLSRPSTPTCRWGRSPHAPYTVDARCYKPLAILPGIAAVHLAESREELELLEYRTGPFVPFLQSLGVWEPDGLIRDPREFLRTNPEQHLLVVHGNFLPGDTPLSANQSLVICPRTHAAFGHPPHPFREFMKRGVRVCLGTDSLASNPDLDILAEARFVKRRYPDFDGETLLKMVTVFGAEALGWAAIHFAARAK